MSAGPTYKGVKSSTIKEIAYHEGKLYVRFLNGGTFCYPDVSEEAHKKLLAAESIGKYFHAHIRNKHTGSKV
jgi:KTSC domain